GERDLQAPAVEPGGEQAAPLEGLGDPPVGEGVELGLAEGLAVRDELHEGPLLVGEPAEPALDDLDEPVGGGQVADEPPQDAVVDERAVVEGAQDELPEEEGVALAAVDELAGGRR